MTLSNLCYLKPPSKLNFDITFLGGSGHKDLYFYVSLKFGRLNLIPLCNNKFIPLILRIDLADV